MNSMNSIIKTSILSLFLISLMAGKAYTVEHLRVTPTVFITSNISNILPIKVSPTWETLKKLQEEAKKQATIHTTEYTRLQMIFDKMHSPKKKALTFISTRYKKKYITVRDDLKEFKRSLTDGIKKLSTPLPANPTDKTIEKYRDLLTAFGNNANRTLMALRDELKWLKGDKNARFELFKNYKEADDFLSKGKK